MTKKQAKRQAQAAAEKTAHARHEADHEAYLKHPETAPCFILLKDWYYLGLWFQHLPQALCKYEASGGDITMEASRKLSDVAGPWRVKMRFRYYLGKDPQDPWSGQDKKDWYCYTIKNQSETQLLQKMGSIMQDMAIGANLIGGGIVHLDPYDFLELRCPGDEAGDKMMAAKKSWLHFKAMDELEETGFFAKLEAAKKQGQLARAVEKSKPGHG